MDRRSGNQGAQPRSRARLATVGGLLASALLLVVDAAPAAAQEFGEIVGKRREYNIASAKSQERIDAIADTTDTLFSKYKATLDQIDALRIYNRQMTELVNQQQAEIDSLEGQIDGVELVGRQVTPLMLQMVETLEQFVNLDVPFLMDERRERIANLRELMNRADVSNAEKYRKIMEAYQIENDFGRTIEAYSGNVDVNGQTTSVDFLRVGRISYTYMLPDASEAHVWVQNDGGGGGQWARLPDELRSSIRKGLRIARKQAAPDLLELPIATPEVAQ